MIRIIFTLLLLSSTLALAETSSYNGQLTFTHGDISKTVKNLPKFEDFPAEQSSTDIADDIDWKSDKNAKIFRTRLRKGLAQGPNFNGHYAVIMYGCGTMCQGNFIIDTKNGKIVGSFDSPFGASFSKNSSLVVANLRNSPIDLDEYGIVSHSPVVFFKVENDQLISVRIIKSNDLFEFEDDQ